LYIKNLQDKRKSRKKSINPSRPEIQQRAQETAEEQQQQQQQAS